MKRIIASLLCLVAAYCATNAQSTIIIAGTPFDIRCDAVTGTAEIYDNNYNPDERRYPYKDQSRNFEDMTYNSQKIVEIPSTFTLYGRTYKITKIGKSAFADFQNVKIIYVPSTVTEIDEYAFFRSSVEEVYVSASVKRIGNRAFGRCKKLKTLSLPSQLDFVGDRLYAESPKVVINRSLDIEPDVASVDNDEANPLAGSGISITKVDTKHLTNFTNSSVDRDIPLNATDNKNTFALIIANEHYENEAAVDFALNDGLSFRDYCQQTLGIPIDNIHFRTNATLNHLVNEFDWLSKIDSPEANIILYYAGHGIPDSKTGYTYLLPVDGNGHNARTGYKLNELYEQLNELEAAKVVVFLDACFSGTKRDETMMASARGGVALKAKPQDPKGKIIVFSATQDDQTAHSYDDEHHGMFTFYLLKCLQETQGNVSLGKLADYIHANVVSQSKLKNSKLQTPTVNVGKSYGGIWRELRLR